MTQEEKAKAYDEALATARRLYNMRGDWTNLEIEFIFPELKESEDEKIRKALMQNLKERFGTKGNMGEGLYMPNVLAWLEKQGEHANFRNKIQVGDKVTRNEDGVLVNLSQLNRVAKREESTYTKKDVDDAYLKGISDTKNELEKQGEQKHAWSEEDDKHLNNIINRTKAFGDSSIYGLIKNDVDWIKKLKDRVQPQQKQEWSISDERILNNIFTYLGYAKDGNKYCTPELICEAENWLKSLKERLKGGTE